MDVDRQIRRMQELRSRLSTDLNNARQSMETAQELEYTDDGGNWNQWIEAHDDLSYALSACAELQTLIIDIQREIIQEGAKCWDAPKGKKK